MLITCFRHVPSLPNRKKIAQRTPQSEEGGAPREIGEVQERACYRKLIHFVSCMRGYFRDMWRNHLCGKYAPHDLVWRGACGRGARSVNALSHVFLVIDTVTHIYLYSAYFRAFSFVSPRLPEELRPSFPRSESCVAILLRL